MKIYITYILMVAVPTIVCFFCRIDYSDNTKAEHQPPADGIYSLSHNHQGSLEIQKSWGTGVRYKVVPDSIAQALDESIVSIVLSQDTCAYGVSKEHPLEPEPLDMDELMCQLATIHKQMILVMTEKDSAVFMDSASIANIQSTRWIR